MPYAWFECCTPKTKGVALVVHLSSAAVDAAPRFSINIYIQGQGLEAARVVAVSGVLRHQLPLPVITGACNNDEGGATADSHSVHVDRHSASGCSADVGAQDSLNALGPLLAIASCRAKDLLSYQDSAQECHSSTPRSSLPGAVRAMPSEPSCQFAGALQRPGT